MNTRLSGHIRIICGQECVEQHNLETDYTLTSVAKLLVGETPTPIEVVSIAFGSGDTELVSTSTALDSELFRRALTAPGSSKERIGSKAIFRVTLGSGEVYRKIGCLGLFGPDSGTGSAASGTLTVGGTPATGSSITVKIGTVEIPTFFCTGGATVAETAQSLANWLNGDDTFTSLYNATVSGAVITAASIGKGTTYNRALAAAVTGTVTCSASGVSGGTTPGGQLLAAANVSYTKYAGREVLVEWWINVSN